MTERAIHGVELHSVDEILIVRHQRIADARSMTIHGGVDGSHGQMAFEMRGLDVGRGWKKSEHGNAEDQENYHDKRNNDAEKELTHETSAGILADAKTRR